MEINSQVIVRTAHGEVEAVVLAEQGDRWQCRFADGRSVWVPGDRVRQLVPGAAPSASIEPSAPPPIPSAPLGVTPPRPRASKPARAGINPLVILAVVGSAILVIAIFASLAIYGVQRYVEQSKRAMQAEGVGNSGIVDENGNFQSLDGAVTIPNPGDYRRIENDVSPDASMFVGNLRRNEYLVVVSEPSVDMVDTSLRSYFVSVREQMLEFDPGRAVGVPVPEIVNGHEALSQVLELEVENLRVTYLLTAVKTSDQFHQLLQWTLRSRYSEVENQFKAIARSVQFNGAVPFVEIPQRPSAIPPGSH